MVLTTSFPYSPPSSTADAARTRGADASAVVLRPGKPRAERVRAARTCSVRLGPVSGAGAGLPGLGTCFESRREALWGWGGGGGAASRAGGSGGGRGRFHFFRGQQSGARAGAPPPPRPRLPSGPRSRACAGPAPPLWLADSARPPPAHPHARPPPPPSSWCGPWRAHHGD